LFHSVHNSFSLQPHILELEISSIALNSSTIKEDGKMVCAKSRDLLRRHIRKTGFPIQRN